MKKIIIIIFMLLITGMTNLKDKNDQIDNEYLSQWIIDVEFFNKFNKSYFDYFRQISSEYYTDSVDESDCIEL